MRPLSDNRIPFQGLAFRGIQWMLLSLIAFTLTGQDSLLALVESRAPSSTKVQWYIQLSLFYADELKSDSALLYAQKAIELSREDNLFEQTAEAYYALGYVFDLTGNLENALHNYEESRRRYETLDIKNEVATCMNSKGVAAYFKGDYQ